MMRTKFWRRCRGDWQRVCELCIGISVFSCCVICVLFICLFSVLVVFCSSCFCFCFWLCFCVIWFNCVFILSISCVCMPIFCSFVSVVFVCVNLSSCVHLLFFVLFVLFCVYSSVPRILLSTCFSSVSVCSVLIELSVKFWF